MKRISLLLLSLIALSGMALAQTSDANMSGASVALGILFMILWMVFLVVVFVGGFVLWILMLIDCIKRDFKKENDKIIWILVIALLGTLGAIIYYFAVKREDRKVKKKKSFK